MDKLISRQMVLDIVDSYSESQSNVEENKKVIAPQPETGYWEWLPYDYNSKLGDWCCSKCRSVVMECVKKDEKGGIPLYKYCPQCGRKIQEAENGRDSAESEE